MYDCKICKDASKTKCWFCHKKRLTQKELDRLPREERERLSTHYMKIDEELKFVLEIKAGMKKFSMRTTGSASMDKRVRNHENYKR